MRSQISCDSVAGGPSNSRTDRLDHYHQWVGQQQSPTQAKAELSASLCISGNATGIVVRGPGDQTWAEYLPEPWFARPTTGEIGVAGNSATAFDTVRRPNAASGDLHSSFGAFKCHVHALAVVVREILSHIVPDVALFLADVVLDELFQNFRGRLVFRGGRIGD